MIFQDNVIKNYLKNVYFITGTPCGGKTTVSNIIGRKYGIPVYNVDAMFSVHQSLTDKISQPYMNKKFTNADEFFSRTADEYRNWLINNTREQLDFVLLDLIRISQNGKLLCDCHLTPEQANKITEPSRVAFLIKEPINIADEYCSRSDHKDFSEYINSASNSEEAKKLCNTTLFMLNKGTYDSIKHGSWFFIDRADGLSADYAAEKTAEHFGFSSKDNISMVKVESNTNLASELVNFIKNSSWEDAKEHIAELLRKWDFSENEAVFAAIANDKIVGMATLMNSDYYPLPEIFPWVSCIFVTEEFRGRRISEKLISYANSYAISIGYDRTYIPSPYLGLYEKYGYKYLRDIVNYGGETDHLFVKEL